MTYTRACFLIFGILTLLIISLSFIANATIIAANTGDAAATDRPNVNTNLTKWHIDKWYAVKWITRTSSRLSFELHLLPPTSLDCQAKIVFLRNRIMHRIPARENETAFTISFGRQKKRYVAACCFSYATVLDALLDFHLDDMFTEKENDVSVIHFDVRLK